MGARSSKITAQNNRSDGHLLEYFRNTFIRGGGGTNPPPAFGSPQGLAATGGVISDYTDPGSGNVYRTHIFTSSGTFNVTASGNYGNSIEYLVVGGGGGGGASGPAGNAGGGGGGAGGLRTNLPGVQDAATNPLTASSYSITTPFPSSYTVTVGGGGSRKTTHAQGGQGGNSEFYPTPATYPSTAFIRSVGGGGGGFENPNTAGAPGGSGGAGGRASAGGSGNTPSDPNHPLPMGKDGYGPGGGGQSGGGGGAGEAGQAYPFNPPSAQGGRGGNGVQVLIAESPETPSPQRTIGADGGYFAGGGGGGGIGPGPEVPGGLGGGGRGGQASPTQPPGTWEYEVEDGTYATGGGGGGGSAGPTAYSNLFKSGAGGSGIVVVRYQIGRLTATAKASGGAISFYNNKIIHTFTASGTFTTPATFNETVEYLVVGGGGGGGAEENSTGSGGGGAGAYRTNTTPISGPQTISIQVGAGGRGGLAPGPAGPNAALQGVNGTSSYFSAPITAPGGGGGAGDYPASGNPGGSGGGGKQGDGGGTASGSVFPGTIGSTPTSGWGHNGGGSVSSPPHSLGGGGGGAGSIGTNGTSTQTGSAGFGGSGIQAPTTFRDPNSTVGAPGPTGTYYTGGDNSGKYWFAGGGGAGTSGK